jgi:hypothetical protein
MPVFCRGRKDGRYQILESDPHVLLVFEGPDASKFQQINPPPDDDPNTKRVKFSLEVDSLNEEFPCFLTEANREQSALPHGICSLGPVLELLHFDFHDECHSHPDEAAESYKLYQDVATNYLPRLSRSQLIRLLGVLVLHLCQDDPRSAEMA